MGTLSGEATAIFISDYLRFHLKVDSLLERLCPPGKHTVFLWLYDRVFFSFQNDPKTLDPSYTMDLDL